MTTDVGEKSLIHKNAGPPTSLIQIHTGRRNINGKNVCPWTVNGIFVAAELSKFSEERPYSKSVQNIVKDFGEDRYRNGPVVLQDE